MNKQWKPKLYKRNGFWYWQHDRRVLSDRLKIPVYYQVSCERAMHFCHRLNAQVRYEKL